MQFFQLGSKVKFRTNEAQPYEHGIIVGHAVKNPDHLRANPVYLIELSNGGFYLDHNPMKHFISTLVVSCDCVELDLPKGVYR